MRKKLLIMICMLGLLVGCAKTDTPEDMSTTSDQELSMPDLVPNDTAETVAETDSKNETEDQNTTTEESKEEESPEEKVEEEVPFEGNIYEKMYYEHSYNHEHDFEDSCYSYFTLYDINGDGTLDLLVTGPLGLRSKMFSYICIPNGDDYKFLEFDGEITRYRDQILTLSDPDYEQAGAIRFEHYYIISFNSMGDYKTLMEHERQYTWYDPETDTVYDPERLDSESYFINEVPATETEFNATIPSFSNTKEFEWHELSPENVTKYLAPL